jgi:subtilisin family serine protease
MKSCCKFRVWCIALAIFAISTVALINAPAAETWKQIIVKCSPGDLDRIRTAVGAAVIDAIPGHFLITVPATVGPLVIEGVPGQGPIEASDNGPIFIPRTTVRSSSSTTTAPPPLGPIVDWHGTPARQGYTEQTVVGKVALKQALNIATGSGVRVALIDTGVDLNHPTLNGVFVGGTSYVGYNSSPDFLNDTTFPRLSQSSANFLEQSSANFLEQSAANFLEQSSANFLEQSSANFLEQATISVFLSQSAANFLEGTNMPLFASHGTMMAGLIHLMAPHARITPIAAFHATGDASEWDIVRAIYVAIDSGDQVINMSFESDRKSKIMQDAIQAALLRGIVVVASAGNNSSDTKTYPGSFDGVIRVAALRDDDDQITSFSNYGIDIGVSATGTRLISTWIGGHWGMISGTSPAAALVTGEVALVKQLGSAGNTVETNVDSINWPPQYRHKLGKGRINALKAVTAK